MEELKQWIENLLGDMGIAAAGIPYVRLLILLVLLIIASYIALRLTKKIVVNSLYHIFRRTTTKWDDVLVDRKVFASLAYIVPAIMVKLFAPVIFRDFVHLLPLVIKLANSFLMIVGMMLVLSFLKALEIILASSELFIEKPISSYFQLIRILIYIATAIFILSELMGQTPWYFLSAFGAMTAILLLIFKDTILGLVASVQISSNDMVRVGDWVEMPKFNADGDVIAINLNTVKIRNWDKTITTVPTYYFITDSFKNWRGMQESGGRRIKRSIFINVRSIQFVSPETREEFKHYHLIRDFIQARQLEIEAYNASHQVDTEVLINGRRMTNVGVFRYYTMAYLKTHPHIRQDMTLLVRQLAMEDRGLPLEIYCFTNTIRWAEYEEIQANIFDHLLAAARFFHLELFQQPSGSDISMAVQSVRSKG